jgi:K+-transporting ATPase A subunit
MAGRTPEYLGKKIGPPEAKMLTIYTLALPFVVLRVGSIIGSH